MTDPADPVKFEKAMAKQSRAFAMRLGISQERFESDTFLRELEKLLERQERRTTMQVEFEVLNDIIAHISEVAENLSQMVGDLEQRAKAHDRSKFEALEFDAFVKTRPQFRVANYGTPEYQECVDAIKPSVDHHYAVNRHHTGFFSDGFSSMNLFDVLEMLADWRAASRRSPDLTFRDSLPRAYSKYGIPENMQQHIEQTLAYLGWT